MYEPNDNAEEMRFSAARIDHLLLNQIQKQLC